MKAALFGRQDEQMLEHNEQIIDKSPLWTHHSWLIFGAHIWINIYIFIIWAPLEHIYLKVLDFCWLQPARLTWFFLQVAEGLHEIAIFHILWHVPKSYLDHRRRKPFVSPWLVDSVQYGEVKTGSCVDSCNPLVDSVNHLLGIDWMYFFEVSLKKPRNFEPNCMRIVFPELY